MQTRETLADRILDHQIDNVAIRHDLHRHPELGYEEVYTSGVVARTLESLGIEVRSQVAGTGVVGYLPSTRIEAKTIALRADMDALPIQEAVDRPYASQTPGKMHACGHDGHTAILLGTARALVEVADRPNHVLFIFQPAEEGGAGADRMCKAGVLEGKILGTSVDRVFGLHGFPNMPLGHVATKVGPLLAAATEMRIEIRGKGSHAAYPHFGIDPIVAAAHLITALQTVASRNVGPLDSVVVTIGSVDAGYAHNVIPDMAILKGTLRTLRDETDVLARRRIEEIVSMISSAFGTHATLEWVGSYPVTVNDPTATEWFRDVAIDALGVEHVHEAPEPSMGAEDFAFYGRQVPACFYLLGLCPSDQEHYPGLHTPEFDFNDDAIPVGIRVMSELALRELA